MQVTLKVKEGWGDHWEIWIEGEKWRDVHRAIFGKRPTFPLVDSYEQWLALFEAVEYRRVKGYVLWRLSAQSYHSEQLAKLLKDRLIQERTIKRILEELKDSGYLDDEAWLQVFMRSQQKRYSLRFILSKLKTKGLSTETLQQLAYKWKNPKEELQSISHLLKTRFKSKDLSQYKEKQKVIGALLRKGYSFDQIHESLENIK